MKALLLLTTLTLISCGDGNFQEKEPTPSLGSFEGHYVCDNHSQVELIEDEFGRITFETTGQSINSINPKNNSLASHPSIGDRDLLVKNHKIIMAPRNYTYSSSTHDVEQDVSGGNISGSKRTDIIIEKVLDGMKITIKIFDGAINSINKVVANRTINCEL